MEITQPLLSGSILGKVMLARVSSAENEHAWTMGDLAYDFGDTFEVGIDKAAKAGIRPGTPEYAAFITAFSRRLRAKQVSPQKLVCT